MKSVRYSLLLVLAASMPSCFTDDFLTRPPLDQLTDDNYWTSESNVRTFAYDFYTDFFAAYGTGYFTWGGYFWGSINYRSGVNDDFAPFVPTQYPTTVPNTSGAWTFTNIRRANLMLERVPTVPMSQEAINHWTGVARFFRAMEYADKVNQFGDFPWYDRVLDETDPDLYKPRDARTVVMDHVLEDFLFAAENVRIEDPLTGPQGLVVNRDVVLAFMSRAFLFEGTFLKYHGIDQSKANEYLEAARWAAMQLIEGGRYSIDNEYRGMFSALSLAGSPEVIMYRSYADGEITHSLHTYVTVEAQTGVSKDLIDSYLMSDGLPIGVSPLFVDDNGIDHVMADRDPRMAETFVNELRLSGLTSSYSTTGYAVHKFLNESIRNAPEGTNSNFNPTDAVVIRYGEVLLNYAEATAELGMLTQSDLDISINQLRARAVVNMPPLQVLGGQPAANGVAYDDPARDPTVSALLWEIRRERRIELVMEAGLRNEDLRRWRKLEYANTQNSDVNRGAWINAAEWPAGLSVTIEGGGTEGYIIPASAAASQRTFIDSRVYLSPVPLGQITLYDANGATLTQNPGW